MQNPTAATRGARAHESGIESANRRGECDSCYCIAPALYQVWCEAHCFDVDNIDGDFAYCSSCARRIDRNHSARYAGVAR